MSNRAAVQFNVFLWMEFYFVVLGRLDHHDREKIFPDRDKTLRPSLPLLPFPLLVCYPRHLKVQPQGGDGGGVGEEDQGHEGALRHYRGQEQPQPGVEEFRLKLGRGLRKLPGKSNRALY